MKHLAVQMVLRHWAETQVPDLPGSSAATLRSVQASLGVVFPNDFSEFYSATNGTSVPRSEETDRIGWSFHRLHELSAWPDSPWIFSFADWREECFTMGIALKEGGASDVIGGVYRLNWGPPSKIADSFSDFLELYVRDDTSLYPKD